MRVRESLSLLIGLALYATVAVAQTNTFPSSGNVGIGTTAPRSILDVRDQIAGGLGADTTGGVADWNDSTNARSGNGYSLLMGNASNGPGPAHYFHPFSFEYNSKDGTGNMTQLAIPYYAAYTDGGSNLYLRSRYSGTWSPWIKILSQDQNGNVGIGTASPSAKLELNGNLKLTAGSGSSITFQDGTTQSTAYTGVTCGGDYAESVDVTGDRTQYEPGDVLVIDANAPGKFLKSSESYSTSVTGIYSTRPGTVGRRQATPKSVDEVPMAMVGIVPVKVSAENGPIRLGDLLVTSSKVGYAMRGTDRSRMLGAVIGKALGSLDSGTGTIEIVVLLQ